MPLEIKHIYFTERELKKALVNFLILKKQFLEIGDVRKTIINKGDSVTVTLMVESLLGFENDRIYFTQAEVAASLFAFCMVSKIPIPRRGSKELHADNDRVYLTITLEEEVNFEKYVISDLLMNSSEAKKRG